MYPILFRIGNFSLHTYGVFVTIGFLAGLALVLQEAKQKGYESQKILDLALYLIISAILGSRLLFLGINYRYYWNNPLEIFKIWKGGLVFYGGLLLAWVVCIYYLRRKHLPFWSTLDIFAPALALGQTFGRLGCFSAGCCYGKESTLPWAVTFTDPNSLAPLGVALHPAQLYSALANFSIFLILIIFKRDKPFPGKIALSYLILYSTFRFFLEFLRGDPRGFVLEGLISTSQFISLILFPISIFLFFFLKRKSS